MMTNTAVVSVACSLVEKGTQLRHSAWVSLSRGAIGLSWELLRHLTPPALGFLRENSARNDRQCSPALEQIQNRDQLSTRQNHPLLRWSPATVAGSYTDNEQILASGVLPSSTDKEKGVCRDGMGLSVASRM